MKVLVACERSGKTRDAFIARGHDAISCDLHPSDAPGPHYQGDVRDLYGEPFDLLIAHPDCTYLASSGLHWNHKVPGRAEKTEEALAFVRLLLTWPNTPRKAIENPIGCISTRIRKPDQIIQPHQFGHDASKSTCLWLENLPPLTHTQHVAPRWVCPCDPKDHYQYPGAGPYDCLNCLGACGPAKPRWANQTNSGQNRLPPSADRARIRSETYDGWSAAMADQWGPLGPFDELQDLV